MSLIQDAKRKELFIRLLVVGLIIAGVGGLMQVSQLFALNPIPLANLSFDDPPEYRAIKIEWPKVETAKFYAIYRSDDVSGSGAARIAVTEDSSFKDSMLIPGSTHYYIVLWGDNIAAIKGQDPKTLDWANAAKMGKVPVTGPLDDEGNPVPSPHKGPEFSALAKDGCTTCHQTHDASNANLIVAKGISNRPNIANALCADCHEDSSAIEKTFVANLYDASKSGHLIDSQKQGDGKIECATCHNVHLQSSVEGTGLIPGRVLAFGTLDNTADAETLKVDPNDKAALCVTCHDDEQTWWTATKQSAYPASPSAAESELPGYSTFPTNGSYPGKTLAQDQSSNAHAKIMASANRDQGDCRYCHNSHASDAPYAGLLTERGAYREMLAGTPEILIAERKSGDYAAFCLDCHNAENEGTPWAAAADIKSLVTLRPGDDANAETFLHSKAGHVISSENALIPTGTALPCYLCHAAHGSSANNAKNLNPALGSNLTGDRNTCFACHTTSDGYVLAANGTSYELVSAGTAKVIGLSRTGVDTVSGTDYNNKLKLPTVVDAHEMASDVSCSGCHGSVHAPEEASGTGDPDGRSCLQCHNGPEYPEALKYEFVVGGSNEALDWESGYNPHLIPAFSASMGENFFPEAILTNSPSPDPVPIDPTKTTGAYCSGCHAWHTTELSAVPEEAAAGAGRETGATLRKNYNSSTVSNTDFSYDPAYPKVGGLCFSCHNSHLAESSVGAPVKGPINNLNVLEPSLFAGSLHDYSITINRLAAVGGADSATQKTFSANCTKCHNDADPIANPLENRDSLDFKAHYTEGRRLMARFGIIAEISDRATGDTPLETSRLNYNNRGMCFGCHARVGEIAGNAGKAYPGKDWYGQESVNDRAPATYRDAGGNVIGTLNFNNEAVFDDMYRISLKPGGYPSGDGAGGAADTDARTQLYNGREAFGHFAETPKSEWKPVGLKPYITNSAKITSIRCSDCHNVHSTDTGTMGTHSEWPLTKKALVGAPGGVESYAGNATYPDNTTPAAAIAADGSRLITLNDYWSRVNLTDDVKTAVVAWLQTPAGGSLSAAEAEQKYFEMDYNGISPTQVATATGTSENAGLALQWSRTVDIFCFRCHDEQALQEKAHARNSHRTKAVACVDCHLPYIHGGKLPGLIGDRESIPGIDGRSAGAVAANHVALPDHQIFRWTRYDYNLTNTQTISAAQRNQPTLKIYSVNNLGVYNNRSGCGSQTANGGCHAGGAPQGTQLHWNTPN